MRRLSLRADPALLRCVLFVLASSVLTALPAAPSADAEREATNLATFDRAWSLIAETHWDPTLGGLDWNAVRDELRPKAAAAADEPELRRVIAEMVARLGQSHFAVLPNEAAAADASAPDARHDDAADALPGCSPVASAAIHATIERHRSQEGAVGVDLRLLEHQQVVVTRVTPNGPAAKAGIEPGWRLLAVDGEALLPALACIGQLDDPAFRRQLNLFWLRGLLDGPVGSDVRLRFEGERRRESEVSVRRQPPAGEMVRFGNLPPSPLEFERTSVETKRHARVAVVRFNIWLPPVATYFETAMPELRLADAIVVDLRGNPGGVSAVAQGVAGHFVDEQISLGTMKGRRDRLELVAQPRRVARDGSPAEPYRGPLAVLIDEGSASTSELFAAGLRDHDRVRLFGSRSAGAALPAVMDRLPNGDVFLHAAMDYIRPNGERVEGRPIVPDVETPLRRADLRAGRDAALQAALSWIDDQLRAGAAAARVSNQRSE